MNHKGGKVIKDREKTLSNIYPIILILTIFLGKQYRLNIIPVIIIILINTYMTFILFKTKKQKKIWVSIGIIYTIIMGSLYIILPINRLFNGYILLFCPLFIAYLYKEKSKLKKESKLYDKESDKFFENQKNIIINHILFVLTFVFFIINTIQLYIHL